MHPWLGVHKGDGFAAYVGHDLRRQCTVVRQLPTSASSLLLRQRGDIVLSEGVLVDIERPPAV
jgi:hypothetical protein